MNWIEYQNLLNQEDMETIAVKMGLPINSNKWSTSDCVRFEQQCTKEKAKLLLAVNIKSI